MLPLFRFEFLGKIAIPLLKIEPGKKKWFALKDKKMRCRAKGANPQILMEMDLVWNPIRASIRTLNPKEEKYMQVENSLIAKLRVLLLQKCISFSVCRKIQAPNLFEQRDANQSNNHGIRHHGKVCRELLGMGASD